jgi:hypothetical protein
MCAAIAGVMAVSTAVQAQGTPKQAPILTDPPHLRSVGVPGVASTYDRRVSGANGSQVVSFLGFSDPVRFKAPNQSFIDQGGCFTQRTTGTTTILDVQVYCTMYIWDYKNFVGADVGMRKPENANTPSSQWSTNSLPNALLARNQVRNVSGPATMVPIPVQSGIVRDPALPGVDHGKIVVGFTIKPTAATGSVVVSIDGDPRLNNTGTSDDFTRTISW